MTGTVPAPIDFSADRVRVARALEALTARCLDGRDGPVFDAIRYSLAGEGKRLRAVLVMSAYRAAGGTGDVSPLAAAVEVVHAYSLVHDDLPGMDDDAMRRGRATVHVVYGVPAATAAGMAMVPLAARAAAEAAAALGLDAAESAAIVGELMRASGAAGMIGGQLLDLEGEGRSLTLDELERIHRLKTGALIEASMTLGGLAIAVGELVDDAIVDVENVWRRLREAPAAPEGISPLARLRATLERIRAASSEVRNSIVYSTVLVVLVFVPLFALDGVEGRLFAPLGVAYVTAILASMVVSITVTPVLCCYLLPKAAALRAERGEGAFVRWLKRVDARVLRAVLPHPGPVLAVVAVLVGLATASIPLLGTSFLPPFNEGTATVNVVAAPGTSLEESDRLAQLAEEILGEVPEVARVGRRTGRAEGDEHAEGVHYTEIDVDFAPEGRPRDAVLADIRARLGLLPGGNPLAYLAAHVSCHRRIGIGDRLALALEAAQCFHQRLRPGFLSRIIELAIGVGRRRHRILRDCGNGGQQGQKDKQAPHCAASLSCSRIRGRSSGRITPIC